MSINYDPDEKAMVTPAMFVMAEELRMHPVSIVCDEPNAQVGDPTGVSFLALMPFLPNIGDRIGLEDGEICEVKRVYHRVTTRKDEGGKVDVILLMPSVAAVRVPKQK